MRYAYYGNNDINKINKDNWIYDDNNPNIVFSFGGDGTMLSSIHKYMNNVENILFVGIKCGNLGFFYSYNSENFIDVVEMIDKNNYSFNKYNLLEYNINNEMTGYALNEIAITNPIHTQIIDVYINDNLFEKFRGTGFICSPPCGSTAYSKSSGGGIISTDLEAFQLVEIASLNNKIYNTIKSPLIFSKNYNVKLVPINKEHIYISVDGIECKTDEVNCIKLCLSNKCVNILNINEDFFMKVKNAFLK